MISFNILDALPRYLFFTMFSIVEDFLFIVLLRIWVDREWYSEHKYVFLSLNFLLEALVGIEFSATDGRWRVFFALINIIFK